VIDLQDIEAARLAIGDAAIATPCLLSAPFSQEAGARVYLKLESLQRTGSFKVRGAANKIRSLGPAELGRGVITASAGNHAQAVAFSASRLGAAATVVMPLTTPLIKIEGAERLGARVVLAGDSFDEAYAAAEELCEREGQIFIPPFEDERVIAGQGTIGLELLDQLPDLEVAVVPVGGGGLIAGIAAAIKAKRPAVRVYGVQTEAAPALAESFRAGHLVAVPSRRSVADGIAVKRPGRIPFPYIQRYVDGIVTVAEEGIRAAVIDLLETAKILAEGAAAAALAALRGGALPDLAGKTVALVLSGGNIDVDLLARIIDRSLVERQRLVRLRTHVGDRPGGLAELLRHVAAAGGNVVRVQHDRVFERAGFWEAEVQLSLETRNAEHVRQIERALAGHGYEVERLD
jgi:threonine dehydratase